MKFYLLLLSFFTLSTLAQGQPERQFSIRGTLVDDQNKPVPFGTVALYQNAKSTPVTGAISDEAGKFEIRSKAGQFSIKISAISYQDRSLPSVAIVDKDLDLGNLTIKSSTKRLEEVVVKGERSQMELALDKKIFNVGKDLANAGGTASDILSNVPSVAVDAEGNVSLRGSNSVRILIDGKPSGLVSFKGGSGLQQLQGSSIERVEVITNPSARYEAEGMGGIINIVLKKEHKEGINGSFDLITGYPANFGLAANVNYRRKNLNFFVNYTASYRNTPGRSSLYQELYRNDTTFVTQQNSTSNLKGQNNNARAGLDYFFNAKNVLTAAYTYRLSKGKRFADINYRDYQSNLNNLRSITSRTQDETETEPNSEYTLTYKRTFAREGHELTADIRYLDNWESSDQYFAQQTFQPDGRTQMIPSVLQRSINDETEKQFLVQVDYIRPFSKNGKVEAGLRSSSRDMTNDYSVTQQAGDGAWSPLPGLTNYFIYEERINAAYGIIGNKARKFSYQAGLRGEITDVTTTLRQTNDVNPRHYANLFPSVHFTYDLPRQHALQLSFSRRIRRPQYNDLSPFSTFSDNRNFWSGNPNLNPEFTNAFELGHIKYFGKGSISSSVYYRHTNDKILSIRRVNDQGYSTTRPENLQSENSYGAEFAGSYAPYKWWKLDGSFNFFRAVTNGSNLDVNYQSDTYSWFTRLISRFTIWQSTDIQLRGNYEAPQQTPQGRRKALATLDLSVSKDVLNNNGTLTLNVLDVFNSRRFRSITEGPNFYAENSSQFRLRQINLTFSYRLRQAKKKPKEGGEGEF
ncbi:outer membrane beta-barrel family protein [Spirosoma endophyticum]|uniref:Outer membrane receptor proteins, mostly Fe transport n=1 Tax=Spirosoma endophyticum TaxID=662367 RepID=A0A1I2A1J9_9BACT|nr:outer membrane beta-barrel family protein [Spirosoma endophyticum]SFE37647.1 Outer membrane receptor proteins, mostly Fe transport [Spirosoma endophyticum]